jgi:hypothetical protein
MWRKMSAAINGEISENEMKGENVNVGIGESVIISWRNGNVWLEMSGVMAKSWQWHHGGGVA